MSHAANIARQRIRSGDIYPPTRGRVTTFDAWEGPDAQQAAVAPKPAAAPKPAQTLTAEDIQSLKQLIALLPALNQLANTGDATPQEGEVRPSAGDHVEGKTLDSGGYRKLGDHVFEQSGRGLTTDQAHQVPWRPNADIYGKAPEYRKLGDHVFERSGPGLTTDQAPNSGSLPPPKMQSGRTEVGRVGPFGPFRLKGEKLNGC